jgi:hypothetical protein
LNPITKNLCIFNPNFFYKAHRNMDLGSEIREKIHPGSWIQESKSLGSGFSKHWIRQTVFGSGFLTVFWILIRIRIRRIHMFLGHPVPLVRDMDPDPALDPALDPDPSVINQK